MGRSEALNREGKLGGGRRKWKHLAHHLQRLAGLPVEVDLPRLRLDDGFPPARRIAQTVSLLHAHRRDSSEGRGGAPREEHARGPATGRPSRSVAGSVGRRWRILIFHGYLLSGTGSNIYNARLARALVDLGHKVDLLCQDRHPERQPFVDAVGDWEQGELRVRVLREPVRCTAYRPEIGELLPVYVEDPYEGIEARVFARCSEEEIERYIDANVAAVRGLVGRMQPDVALANHLVMGPAILARALAHEVPYAVKVHGSALEYTVKPDPERFLPYAHEGLEPAEAILVGSSHTAGSLWDALADPAIEARTRLGPPGWTWSFSNRSRGTR